MSLCRNKKMVAVMAIGLAMVLANDVWAQRGPGGRGGFGGRRGGMFGASRVQLASLDNVQEALKLTDEQKELVSSLNEEMREARGQFRGGGGGGFGNFAERMAEIEKLNAEATAKLAEKLDEAQNTRLTEIYVQVNGANSLADKAVQAKLGISEEQNAKLEDAREENAEAMRDAFQDFRDMSDEERRQVTQELREESEARLLAVLSDEQKTAFGQLKGEEIEIDMSELFGGRGGRGGFGGGRRGGGGDRPERPE